MDSDEKWLSRKEVAGRLSVSVDTVKRWIDRKLLRTFRFPMKSLRRNRDYMVDRIRESDLEQFIRRNLTF